MKITHLLPLLVGALMFSCSDSQQDLDFLEEESNSKIDVKVKLETYAKSNADTVKTPPPPKPVNPYRIDEDFIYGM